MKIKGIESSEKTYAGILAVYRNPNSTLEEVIKASKAMVGVSVDWKSVSFEDQLRFIRHIVQPAFRSRIKALAKAAKTYKSVLEIWKSLPRDRYREIVTTRVIEVANCKQLLDFYRQIHFGNLAAVALARAFKLAKTQDELWQVVYHAHVCGNKKLWKSAVKKLALKL